MGQSWSTRGGAWCSDLDCPRHGRKRAEVNRWVLTARQDRKMLLLPQVGPPVHPPWHYPPPGIVGQGIRAPQVAWVMRTQATIGPGVLGQSQGLREGLGMLSALHGLGVVVEGVHTGTSSIAYGSMCEHAQSCPILWTVVRQSPLSMRFSK